MASASGVAPVVALDEMDLNRRPNDASVKARFPVARIGASTLGKSAVDLPESVGKVIPSITEVRDACCTHPGHEVAARSPGTSGAEEGVIASEQDV